MKEENKHVHTNNGFIDRNIDVYYLIGILWRYKIFVGSVTFTIAVLSIIYVLLATPFYLSAVTMYPVNKEDGSPLKQLAASLGMSNKTSGYYIYDVLHSRRVSSDIINSKYKSEFFPDSVNLIQFWNLDKLPVSENRIFEQALKNLNGSVSIKEDKETSLITISVVTKDKYICRAIADKYCEVTIDYLNNEEQNSIKKSIVFTQNRLVIVRQKLEKAEKEYVKFQENNTRTVSPSLAMEMKRMIQEIELIRSVVVLLEKQLELLKIEEVKERPIINILDRAEVRDKPIKPKKREVVMVNTILAFFFSFISIIMNEKAKKYGIYTRLKNEFIKK